MAIQIVMDRTGDSRHTFDTRDGAEVEEAEKRFTELTGMGFTAAYAPAPATNGLFVVSIRRRRKHCFFRVSLVDDGS